MIRILWAFMVAVCAGAIGLDLYRGAPWLAALDAAMLAVSIAFLLVSRPKPTRRRYQPFHLEP